jgi:hypothetical protein
MRSLKSELAKLTEKSNIWVMDFFTNDYSTYCNIMYMILQSLGNGISGPGNRNQRTLIAVVLNSANCTVLTVQITLAKLRLTKLHLNPNCFRLRHVYYEPG